MSENVSVTLADVVESNTNVVPAVLSNADGNLHPPTGNSTTTPRNKRGLTPEQNKSFVKQTAALFCSLANCMAGAVVLTLPSVFANSGYVMSSIYMAISIIFSLWGFKVLINACYWTNSVSIYQLTIRCYGKGFAILCDVCIACAYVGFLCSYISIASDYIHQGIVDIAKLVNPNSEPILSDEMWPKLFRVIISFVVMFPLTLLRSMKSLNTISSFAIIFFLVAAFAIFYYFSVYVSTGMTRITFFPGMEIIRMDPFIPVLPDAKFTTKIISYFSLFFTLYTLQANIPPIMGELKGPYQARKDSFWIAAVVSVAFVAVVYILVGIFGSLMFDRECPPEGLAARTCWPLDGNILKSFTGLLPMTIIKLLYAIVILVSYPILVQPCRVSILGWFKAPSKYTKKGYGYFILCGLVVTIIALLLSVFIPNIDDALSIFSSIFGTVIYEVLPLLIMIKNPMLKKYYEKCIKNKLEVDENTNEDNNNAGAIDISYVNFNFDNSLIIPGSTRQSGVTLPQGITGERKSTHVANASEIDKTSVNSVARKDETNNDNSTEESSSSNLEFEAKEDEEPAHSATSSKDNTKEKDVITANLEKAAGMQTSEMLRRASVLQRLSMGPHTGRASSSISAAVRQSMDRRGSFAALFAQNAIEEGSIHCSNNLNAPVSSANRGDSLIVASSSRRTSLIAAIVSSDKDRALNMLENIGVDSVVEDKAPVTEEEWLESQNAKMKFAAELNEADTEAIKELAKDPAKQDERIIKNTFIPPIGKYRGKKCLPAAMWTLTAIIIAINIASISCQMYDMLK